MGNSRYAERDDVVYVQSGNVPSWSKDVSDFWKSADDCERANGRAYRELEFALPRELSKGEQIDLAKKAASHWLGDRHTYTLAVHDREADDGGRNVHAHLMFCERVNDGIERPNADKYFMRAAGKGRDPASGGARKDERWKAKSRLYEIREEWATIANDYLSECGHDRRMDTRSNFVKGLGAPEPKIGPNKRGDRPDPWREDRKEKVDLRRELRGVRTSVYAERDQARSEQERREKLQAEEARLRREAMEELRQERERERIARERKEKQEKDRDMGYGR